MLGDARPLGAEWMHMPQAGAPEVSSFVPQLRNARYVRDRVGATLGAIPQHSFVAARWEQAMTMKYLQSAEGVRPDLTLDPWYEPAHIVRLERWQKEHRLDSHAVVVVDSIAGLTQRLVHPELRRLRNGVTLLIEHHGVRTQEARGSR